MKTQHYDTRMYLVSFGVSDVYKLELPVSEHLAPLAHIENALNDYLRTLRPGKDFAYFTTPKVTEVPDGERHLYAGYRTLDDDALADLKAVMKREVEVRDAFFEQNDTAPFNKVGPKTQATV